jgi:hypothetical protein
MSNASVAPIVMVSVLNGFTSAQRVIGQDVEASPPQLYTGSIVSLWDDGSADVKWDHGFPLEAEKHLVRNGRVQLHHLQRLS